MAVVVPSFPRPDRELRIDLSTTSLFPSGDGAPCGLPRIEPMLSTIISRAAALIETGDTRAAVALLDEIDRAADAPSEGIPLSVRGLRGGLRLSLGDLETGEQLLLEALAAGRTRAGIEPNPRLEAALINNLGVISFRHYSRPTTAEDRFQMAIERVPGDRPIDQQQRLTYRRNIGITRDLIGDYDGAAEVYRLALPDTGENHAAALDIAEALAANREAVGRRDEGTEYRRSAFILLRQWSDEHPLLFARAAEGLSLQLLKNQDFPQLEWVAREHATVCHALLPASEQWRMIQPLTLLAYSTWELNRPAESRDHLHAIEAIRRNSAEAMPGAEAVIEGLKKLYHEHGLNADSLRIFAWFTSILSS